MDPIKCPHASNGICDISTQMIQIAVPLDSKVCTVCSTTKPECSINVVTISRAVRSLRLNNLPIPSSLLDAAYKKTVVDGPGTELKKLISWFVWSKKVKNCSICRNRESRMNSWGPDKCLKNIHTIIAWLRESAVERGYPFSERVAGALIRKAIANSRKTTSSK